MGVHPADLEVAVVDLVADDLHVDAQAFLARRAASPVREVVQALRVGDERAPHHLHELPPLVPVERTVAA